MEAGTEEYSLHNNARYGASISPSTEPLLILEYIVSICLIPGSKTSIGKAAYLGAIATVFGHPGRRFGQMAEALILAVTGTILGLSWSTLGLYLSSLVIQDNAQAAYAIRAIFLILAVLLHGFLRSRTPRLFVFVLLLIICSVVSLTSTATAVTKLGVTQILYPILLAVGVIITVNICLLPEFSSRFLGQTTIDTLDDTAKALRYAGDYFVGLKVSMDAESSNEERAKISGLKSTKNAHQESPEKLTAAERGRADEQPSKEASRLPFFTRYFDKLKIVIYSQTSRAADERDQEGLLSKLMSVSDLTAMKGLVRKRIAECKAAQSECNFELAFSVLPPRDLKEISSRKMSRLVANTIAVIGACESRYALLGEEEDDDEISAKTKKGEAPDPDDQKEETQSNEVFGKRHALEDLTEESDKDVAETSALGIEKSELDQIKPRREIEFGDARLLEYLLMRIKGPYKDLHSVLDRTIEVVSACIAFVYGVPVLPSGVKAPTGITLDELDIHMDTMKEALTRFDSDTASALEGASIIQELEGEEPDIMPREEVFLISSFLLNVRQAAQHIEDMLEHSRVLVERHQARNGRHRIYAPRIKWASWLSTGGDEVEALPKAGRKANRKGETKGAVDDDAELASLNSKKSLIAKQTNEDMERFASADATNEEQNERSNAPIRTQPVFAKADEVQPKTAMLKLRGRAADTIEWAQSSEDLLYAIKLTVAVSIVIWPAFIERWNTWYSLNRGLWAALQLILITEVSIGTAINVFILRGIGTTLGCLWGWAAVEARGGNPIVCAVMICIGIIPCAYVQLGSKYPKAGIVGIVSMCVVSLASELDTVPGTPTQNFLKRWIAFMIGGVVAIIVEMVLLPVKARDRLVESLAAALQQINEMEKCIASGIEGGSKLDVFSVEVLTRFENANSKANTALTAAETFLPFCSNEPRIKGSFQGLALIYGEILFVLHQIVDRMDNMLQLRTAYGSGPLEDLNADIYPYRRNVAGSITVTLFAIHGALTTKLALPQFLPSARLAHLRMINRVREVVLEKVKQREDSQEITAKLARQRAVRRKYMSWNAASAAQAEIIEFLEELIDLTKLLVGANEFRSGLLTRQTYLEYAARGHQRKEHEKQTEVKVKRPAEEAKEPVEGGDKEAVSEVKYLVQHPPTSTSGVTRRRRATTVGSVTDKTVGRRRRGTTSSSKGDQEEIPASLKRIQSRKIEYVIQRLRTNEKQN